jgi:hypothetical protein
VQGISCSGPVIADPPPGVRRPTELIMRTPALRDYPRAARHVVFDLLEHGLPGPHAHR